MYPDCYVSLLIKVQTYNESWFVLRDEIDMDYRINGFRLFWVTAQTKSVMEIWC